MAYFVYLLECQDKSIYTGITTDDLRRFEEPRANLGGHYTRSHKASRMLYTEEYETRSEALKREAEVKKWPREKKLRLSAGAL